MMRPCTDCGEPHDGPGRCPECRREADSARERTRDRASAHWNNTRWKRLSARLRSASPFCEVCGSTKVLEVDHILPIVEFPELVYFTENLRVLCRTHNRTRGHRWTPDEAVEVLQRLQDARSRTGKAKYRVAIAAAQRATDPGEGPPPGPGTAPRVSRETRYTPLTSTDSDESHYVGRSNQEVRA